MDEEPLWGRVGLREQGTTWVDTAFKQLVYRLLELKRATGSLTGVMELLEEGQSALNDRVNI